MSDEIAELKARVAKQEELVSALLEHLGLNAEGLFAAKERREGAEAAKAAEWAASEAEREEDRQVRALDLQLTYGQISAAEHAREVEAVWEARKRRKAA